MTSIDDSLGFVLDLVPGFYALRFMVYVWMFYPRANNGAMVIYSFLKPYLHRWKVLYVPPSKQSSKNHPDQLFRIVNFFFKSSSLNRLSSSYVLEKNHMLKTVSVPSTCCNQSSPPYFHPPESRFASSGPSLPLFAHSHPFEPFLEGFSPNF